MIFILLVMFGISAVFVFPTLSEAQSEQKTFVTHSGGVITTTGEIIDPVYVESTMERSPNYLTVPL
jgi:predicted membrane channel-forming protein YqfA (hemolysin III family)